VTAPLLVFAWGNLSRGDDALGPMCIELLRAALGGRDDVECLEDYQLQIEHALDLVGRQRVLFVDASLSCSAPFEISALQAARDASMTSHALSPQALLQVYRELQGQDPPPCTQLAIRGQRFGLGEPVSPAARAHLDAALRWAQAWLLSASAVPQGTSAGISVAASPDGLQAARTGSSKK
jgi:hydrogenase maturation protease